METLEITQLLGEAHRGNAEAQSRLASVVYDELHRLAAIYMCRERSDHSLQATVLVHDAFTRLVAQGDRSWTNRTHFYAAAAQVMRNILIDHARKRRAEKRGGGVRNLPFDPAIAVSEDNCDDWIAVDQALTRLAERDPRLARIVELRFFAGLSEQEIGAALDVSVRTIRREWKIAKAWLYAELADRKSHDPVAVAPGERNHG